MSEEMAQLYEAHIKQVKDGEVLQGTIIGFTGKEVMVDIGYKSEGFIPKDEFFPEDLEIGNEINVFVETAEDDDGMLILSKRKADRAIGWKKILSEYSEGSILSGRVLRIVKGGFIVDSYGMDCFLPNSLSTFRGKERDVIGKEFKFKVIKINRLRKNIVISRRDALQKEREEAQKKLWEELKQGDVREGIVKNITDFGAFVDLGGVDGLLHITDMSWGKLSHPSELIKVGDKVQVKVLNVDKDTGKVALSIKHLSDDPWSGIEERYLVESKVEGRVSNIMPYGVFVEIEPGVEGLVHVSEMSWVRRNLNPHDYYKVGDNIEAVILSIDPQKRKMSLGVKQLAENPWDSLEEKVPVGEVVKGKIKGFTEYGAFVEIIDGIEGMVHVSDMSWTRKVSHPQEVLKKGEEIEVKVLAVDPEAQRIALGIKQLTPNPWPEIVQRYTVGTVVDGEVVKITGFGVFVKLEKDLEGLIYMSEMDKSVLEHLKPHDKVKVKIAKVDQEQMKIGLSMKGVNDTNKEKEESLSDGSPEESPEDISHGNNSDDKPEATESREEYN